MVDVVYCAHCNTDLGESVVIDSDGWAGLHAYCGDCYDGAPDAFHNLGHGMTAKEAYQDLLDQTEYDM